MRMAGTSPRLTASYADCLPMPNSRAQSSTDIV